VPEDDRQEGKTEEELYMEAAFDLSYDIAEWLECAAHFFSLRFLKDEHEILWIASKCMDLRLFATVNYNDDAHHQAFIEGIYAPLQQIILWMKKGGVQDVPAIDIVYSQAIALADNMRNDITAFYNACANPTTAVHNWHILKADGTREACSGTKIQKDLWTKPRLSRQSPAFLWVYNHCLLKTANEVVVEGMCKTFARQADSIRGLRFHR